MNWEAFKTLFVENLGGSEIFVAIFFLMAIWGLLMLIRATKEVFIGITAIFLFYLVPEGLFPAWAFFLILVFSGIFIATSLIKLFFGGD